ncbi:MAG: Uncharacterized protein CEN90_355 [Parcubacteria group bacterium Licking1014_17]|nr:MAG: Uncharacterized protein CEN90_355 [Parcubacteria group bacterium Licking1014_17]
MKLILRQNEKLIKVTSRHWIFLLPTYIFWILIIVLLFVLRFMTSFDFFGYWNQVVIIAVSLALIMVIYKTFSGGDNVLWLTNQRVVRSERKGMFSRATVELLYKDISEVGYRKEGLMPTVFDYGDVVLRTVSDNPLTIKKVKDPDGITETINRIR